MNANQIYPKKRWIACIKQWLYSFLSPCKKTPNSLTSLLFPVTFGSRNNNYITPFLETLLFHHQNLLGKTFSFIQKKCPMPTGCRSDTPRRNSSPNHTLNPNPNNPSNATALSATTRSGFVKASPLESPKYYVPFSCLFF